MSLFDEQVSRKPNKYLWTQDFIKAMHDGHWTDREFNFKSDIHDFKINLTEEEREVVIRTLSAIGQIEVAVKKFWAKLGDNLPHPSITDLGYVMANVEVIHNNAYERLLSELGLEEIFEKNLKLDVINGRVEYLRKYTHRYYADSKQQYIYALILFTLFIENVSLFSQFYIVLWFGRYKNVLKDTNQQVLYTKNEECYSKNTEVLTPGGWRFVKDMNVGDEVYQYNSDKTFSLTKIESVISKDFKGELIKFDRKANQCIVTPEHDMVYFDHRGNFNRKKAKEIKFHNRLLLPVSATLKDEGGDELSFEDRLKIAIQADGSTLWWKDINGDKHLRGGNGGATHVITLFKSRKKERLQWILDNLNLKYETGNRGDGGLTYRIHFNHDFNYKRLKWVSLKEKSYKWCQEFISEVVEWDGNKTRTNSEYYSIIKENIDIVQTVAILGGNQTSIGSIRKEGYENDCYRLRFLDSPFVVHSHAIKKTVVPYIDKVYCISVPSGVIMTRVNDKTFIAGNCLHAQAGTKIINVLRKEHPNLFTKELETKVIHESETAFAAESKIIDWILGSYSGERLNKDILKEYVKDRINQSLHDIGYKKIFKIDKTLARDFEWMDEETKGNVMSDFFYRKPTEYSKGNKSFNAEELF